MSEERGRYHVTAVADPPYSTTNSAPMTARNVPTQFSPCERFGRLVIVERAGHSPAGHRLWLCRCDCGASATIVGASIRNGRVQSCGCLNRELTSFRFRRHGMHGTRIYWVWQAMIGRCERPADKRWMDYGGRGITVCPEWHDFAAFYRDMGDPPEGSSLDRIDVNGGYCPANCRWATGKEQGRNQRRNRLVEIGGERLCLVAACEKVGISVATVKQRMRRGITLPEAITLPIGEGKKPGALC